MKAVPIAYTTDEISQSYGRDMGSKDSEARMRNELWNNELVGNFAEYDDNEVRDSSTMEDQKRLLHHENDREAASDSLASVMKDREKFPNSPELICSLKAEDFAEGNENELKNSAISSIAASHLLETETNMHTDKIIVECVLPEVVATCKEINYHVVKDICVDDGIPKEKTLLINSKDDSGGLPVCLPPRQCETIKGGHDSLILDGLTGLHSEGDGLSPFLGAQKSATEIPFHKDKITECDQQDLIQPDLVKGGTPGEVERDFSEGSFVDNKLPLEEFGTRSFLRSFLNSLNNEEKEVSQLLNQISSEEVISGSSTLSTEAETNKNFQSSNFSYNNKMDSGGITLNFNSPKPAAARSLSGSTETVNKESRESSEDHEDANPKNGLSVTSQDQHRDGNIGNVHEEHVENRDSSATCSNGTTIDNVSEQSLDHNNTTSNDQSLGSLLIARRNKNPGYSSKHGGVNGDSVSSSGRPQYDDGEMSFSAGDHVSYSGQIPFSGSLSVRSDSTTSARSFAFPVLQSEWNSSPVRMAKADRRHYRKRKDWRSGILCCRF